MTTKFFYTAIAGVIVGAALTAPANAALQLYIGHTNATTTDLTGSLVPVGGGVYTYSNAALAIDGANFEIDIRIETNAPGTPTLAELLTVQTTIRENGAGNENRDVYIKVIDDTFTQPVGTDLVLHSELEFLSQTQGGPGDRLLTSTFDGDSVVTLGPHSFGPAISSATFSSSGTPFSLQSLTYVYLTPNEGVGMSATTWLTSDGVVPEPGTIAIWGVLALSAVVGARKWRQFA